MYTQFKIEWPIGLVITFGVIITLKLINFIEYFLHTLYLQDSNDNPYSCNVFRKIGLKLAYPIITHY